MQALFIWRKYTKISEMEIGTLLIYRDYKEVQENG